MFFYVLFPVSCVFLSARFPPSPFNTLVVLWLGRIALKTPAKFFLGAFSVASLSFRKTGFFSCFRSLLGFRESLIIPHSKLHVPMVVFCMFFL